MKHFLILLFLILLSSREVLFSQSLVVTFINRTGMNLDSLVINGRHIGKIDADSSSKPIAFESLVLGSASKPFEATTVAQGIFLKTWPELTFCGTSDNHYVTSGEFWYSIEYWFSQGREFIIFRSFHPEK